jgi:hypothetical protein
VFPLSPFYQVAPAQPGLVLGYGALPEPALVEAAQILCSIVASSGPNLRRQGHRAAYSPAAY